MFKKGDAGVTLQNPWQNMMTGQREKGTLISIIKNAQQL